MGKCHFLGRGEGGSGTVPMRGQMGGIGVVWQREFSGSLGMTNWRRGMGARGPRMREDTDGEVLRGEGMGCPSLPQGWEFRIEPHVYSAQHGLSSVVMQRSPSARTTGRRWVAAPVGIGEGRGMGPRICEDKGGEIATGQVLRGNNGDGSPHAETFA